MRNKIAIFGASVALMGSIALSASADTGSSYVQANGRTIGGYMGSVNLVGHTIVLEGVPTVAETVKAPVSGNVQVYEMANRLLEIDRSTFLYMVYRAGIRF